MFFNVLCSKTINHEELSKMKGRIVETLCVFEKYFPPSFFVSMTHLVVHLAEVAQICGAVRYRWMYPFEWYDNALVNFNMFFLIPTLF